ncbi:MAG: hypothetical protein MZV64_03345 [Ignavibacteriales bacterium]|nr:hypothetical protein [Ignavibacteriales bacterium]
MAAHRITVHLNQLGPRAGRKFWAAMAAQQKLTLISTNNIYVEYVNLAFYKSTNGGATFVKSMNGIPTGLELDFGWNY